MATSTRAPVDVSNDMILGNYRFLLDQLVAREIVPYYIEDGLMTENHHQEICSKTDSEANRILIYRILKGGPKSLQTFRRALITPHRSFILDKLITAEPRPVQEEPLSLSPPSGIHCPNCDWFISDEQVYDDASSCLSSSTESGADVTNSHARSSLFSENEEHIYSHLLPEPYTTVTTQHNRSDPILTSGDLSELNLTGTPSQWMGETVVKETPSSPVPDTHMSLTLPNRQSLTDTSVEHCQETQLKTTTTTLQEAGNKETSPGFDTLDGPKEITTMQHFRLDNPLNLSGITRHSGERFDYFNNLLRHDEGWCPHIGTISRVQECLVKMKGVRNAYLIWYSAQEQKLVLTLTNDTLEKHLKVKEKKVEAGGSVRYYLYSNGMYFDNVRDLLQYYRQNGIDVKTNYCQP